MVYSYVRGVKDSAVKDGAAKDNAKENVKNAGSQEELGLEISSDGRFILHYRDKDQPERFFRLTQIPGQPVNLALPPADKPRMLTAPTLWHLLIVAPEECRKQVLPLLEAIRPDWRLRRQPSRLRTNS